MTHTDIIKDADAFFEIDPITRVITNKTPDKTKVMQYDHNSERFTFSLPQYIEGHDMLNCNKIEVHYININTNTKEETRGLYEVNDVQAHPDDAERIIFSWLLSQNVTRDAGVVNFIIRFSCVAEDGVIEYAWSSEVFKAISVSAGIYNADVIVELYADVLEQWKQELFAASAEGVENINTAKETAIAEIEETASTLTSLSNALKGTAFGQSVTITDISPVEHNVDVSVQSKNLISFQPNKCSVQQATRISYTDNEITAQGNDGASAFSYSSGWVYFYRPEWYPNVNFTKDTVTISLEVTLIEEGNHGTQFKFGAAGVEIANTIFTATTTPTRFSFTYPVSAIPSQGFYITLGGNTLKIANVQFEYGEVATDYTPYVEDVSGVGVSKYGANLAFEPSYADVEAGATNSSVLGFKSPTLKKGVTYTLSFDTENTGATLQFVTYNRPITMVTSSSATADGTRKSFTFTMTDDFYRNHSVAWVQIGSASTANSGLCSNVQLEVNSAPTDYEPYKEPTTYTVNADGNVEGVNSLYPTTTLMTDTEGVLIDVTYNKDINKAFAELEEKLTNAIISLGGNV